MGTDGIGLYVHIPFCVSKCKYCDFASFACVDDEKREKYINCLISEIQSYANEKKTVNSIFFGGGTPSLLTPDEFVKICTAIRKTFYVSDKCEFTVEVNPKTVNKEKLGIYKKNGVNRISIGMQSIHKKELKYLGRIHDFKDFLDCYRSVLNAGISNINIDVMYGIPHQTRESFIDSLSRVVELEPTHVSVYGLIIEPDTPFYEMRESLSTPTEEEEVGMYMSACELLAAKGYSHYEISNYCKSGFECAHNLKYWEDKEFIGVGLSAYSYLGNIRYGNSRIFSEYLSDDYANYRTVDKIELEDEKFEYVMMNLRTSRGIKLSDYRERFSSDFLADAGDALKKYVDNGLVICSPERVMLTESGFYLSNTIISDIV